MVVGDDIAVVTDNNAGTVALFYGNIQIEIAVGGNPFIGDADYRGADFLCNLNGRNRVARSVFPG